MRTDAVASHREVAVAFTKVTEAQTAPAIIHTKVSTSCTEDETGNMEVLIVRVEVATAHMASVQT